MISNSYWQRYGHKAIQLAILIGLAVALWLFALTIKNRLDAQGIATGFGFLWDRAGFNLGESLIPYDGDDSYGRALLAGFSNTIKVALTAIFASLLFGVVASLAMLSGHATAKRIAQLYIRIVRNTPLLLQLFFWFGVFTVSMPTPKDTYNPIPNLYINNRGISFPAPDGGAWAMMFGIVITLLCGVIFSRRLMQNGKSTGRLWILAVVFITVWITGWVSSGFAQFSHPEAGRFSINGGALISPEFLAIFFGLSVYTGTYIAEVVRGAVEAVNAGQSEAAAALGLKQSMRMRLIILPQATRVALPAIVSELLNLVKNSSLGVAVGYPELVSAGNTAMNQTGQAIELISIYMLFYVTTNYVITKMSHALEARYEW